jgi:hypothetical protein
MSKIKSVLLLFCIVFIFINLIGCASFTSPARQHKLDEGENYWFDYDASRRGTVLLPTHASNNMKICAEPSPDVAMEFANKFLAKLSYDKISAETQAEINSNVIQLAQRTQTIMYLRESLYRLCELSVNYQLPVPAVIELYEKVIKAAEELAKAEISQANATRAIAEAKKAAVDLEMRKLSREIIKEGNE